MTPLKADLEQLIASAISTLIADDHLPNDLGPNIQVTRSKDSKHGDFASNIAMMLAKQAKCPPRELAERIIAALPAASTIEKVEIAGPGFINFYLRQAAANSIVERILREAEDFGRSNIGQNQKVLIEFVSANPTGPLHVGHGRGAAYGEALADLLAAAGFNVSREYYVNDAGRQMDILACSVWLRYLESTEGELTFPTNGYQGQYVRDIAAALQQAHQTRFTQPLSTVFADLPADEPDGGDKEAYIDAMIMRCKSLLADDYNIVFDAGLNTIQADIRDDLHEFRVDFETWFSERELVNSGEVNKCINQLQQTQHIYEKNGALWFKSTDFGDEKDRVVQRENGQATYFASDIAYHLNKLTRGFDQIIDIWGADHHGYVARVKASLQAMGAAADKFKVLLVQFAVLYRGAEKVQMSTRSGSFVTLRELRDEVGTDAARFFYIMRRCEQHMDFDLELAKSQSNDNPVYYVQYAHARIASVFRQLSEKSLTHDDKQGQANLDKLDAEHELKLIKTLSRYPETVESAANNYEPHQLTYYLRDLANDFHSYYNAQQFIVDDAALRDARLTLITAVRQVLRNALAIIGVSAPDSM